MRSYRPDCKCPTCSRTPNVTFSEAEVNRAKLERQGAHVQTVKCGRCGTAFWIRARDIAEATPLTNGELVGRLSALTMKALKTAGIADEGRLRDMLEDGSIVKVPGIGAGRIAEIRHALDLSA